MRLTKRLPEVEIDSRKKVCFEEGGSKPRVKRQREITEVSLSLIETMLQEAQARREACSFAPQFIALRATKALHALVDLVRSL